MSEKEDSGLSSTVQSSTTTIRYWIKLAEPRWPFFPWGLLPLLGLILLGIFGFGSFAKEWMQKTVEERTKEKLAADGFGWAQVKVDGQMVTLSGVEPTAGAGDKAIAAAKDAVCPSFAGEFTCATDVDGKFTQKPQAPVGPWPDYKFTLAAGVLTLTGEVPDEATREKVVAKAKSLFHAPEYIRVQDELKIRKEPIRPGFEAALMRGVETASRCIEGHSSLTKEVFALRCEVHQEVESPLRGDAKKEIPSGTIGGIDLQVKEQVDSCEKDFADALAKSNIEFDTGSAVIRASSGALLDKLAAIANRCPGTLKVEGHTDDRGNLEANMKLSMDRAESVAKALGARKVDTTRLGPKGFGPTKPVGDNKTDDGRARNRRIEFHIAKQAL
jgi:OmpA-OmpF porin, OOP family